MRVQSLLLSLCLLVTLLVSLSPALGHSERDTTFPDGSGSVPEYRTDGPRIVVCKEDSLDRVQGYPAPERLYNTELYGECMNNGFRHIQAAVDAVSQQGTRILVLPGEYREGPSLQPQTGACADLVSQSLLSYAEHVRCPNVQNLIAVLGDAADDGDDTCRNEPLCHLQLEGTGLQPEDVVVDGDWNKLNVLRVDRADGFYVKNMMFQRSEFNAVYILETDGFVIDDTVARWNWEYGFLTFAVDHGLYQDCEAYGNGDAGIYPGSASDLRGVRWSTEIRGCDAHHNMAGYSGTAGNSIYVHDNDFHHNSIGIVMDSLFPGHPGMPQDSSSFTNNRIWSNNENHYDNFLGEDAPCLREHIRDMEIENGTVCPTSPVPVGSGIMVAGGNNNLFAENHIWDNWRYGFILFAVPAPLREDHDPNKLLDTSHFNRFLQNHMGHDVEGQLGPNGLDTWWDEGGAGNCWSDNHAPNGWTSSPMEILLPDCHGMPLVQRLPNLAKLATIAPCALYDGDEMHHPPGCDWMTDPPQPDAWPLKQVLPWQPNLLEPVPLMSSEESWSRTIRSNDMDAEAWFTGLRELLAHRNVPQGLPGYTYNDGAVGDLGPTMMPEGRDAPPLLQRALADDPDVAHRAHVPHVD